jgi:hypothetical protein
MALRTIIGLIACGLYGWRIYDPKQSYAGFYDVANWVTSWLLADGGVLGTIRRIVNLVLLDQVEGFLIGIAIVTLLSLPLWALRKSAGWGVRMAKRSRGRRARRKQEAWMAAGSSVDVETLPSINAAVDFDSFRPELVAAIRASGRLEKARDAVDPVALFRMLVLQDLHGLTLDQTVNLVRDRVTWMRFCGLNADAPFPTVPMLARFRQELRATDTLDPLLARVGEMLTNAGYRVLNGQVWDARLVATGPPAPNSAADHGAA